MKIYLSNWYQSPCTTEVVDERIGFTYDSYTNPSVALNDRQDQVMVAILVSQYITQLPIFLHESALKKCKEPDCQYAQRLVDFCKQNFEKQFPVKDYDGIGRIEWIPLLVYFGKTSMGELDLTYPFFNSYRSAAANGRKSIKKSVKEVDCTVRAQRQVKNALHTVSEDKVMSPIIWDIYDMKTEALAVLDVDLSWGSKVNKAVWRGRLSGKIEGSTFDQKCKSNQRCQLVTRAAELGSLVDAGVTQQRAELTLDQSLHLVKSPMSVEEVLNHKIIIVAEGDGYATTLPWALYSNSVVIMPKPTKTSYLMEEKLEAWIHYIPCKDDFSDLKKKIKWVLKNGDKAKVIAERGTLWIHDLYMSEEAVKENEIISKGIMERYLEFYINENV